MITLQSKIHLDWIGGREIFDFLIDPTDREYQRWWSGTHLALHLLKQKPNNIGNVVYMDELIGKRRMKMTGIIIEAEPGKKILWQVKRFVRLPIWLSLDLKDDRDGVTITHTIKAGFTGIGRILDVILRAYPSFVTLRIQRVRNKSIYPERGSSGN